MLKRLLSTVLVVPAMLLVAQGALAQGVTGKHVATYKEGYLEQVVCQRGGGAVTCNEIPSGRYKAFMQLDLSQLPDVDVAQIAADTTFDVEVAGHILTTVTPSLDPRWRAGKRAFKATTEDGAGDNAIVSVIWNAKKLLVAVDGFISVFDPDPVVVDNLGLTGLISGTTDVCVEINTGTPVRLCAQNGNDLFTYQGKAVTRTIGRGGDVFEISRITVEAKGSMIKGLTF